MLLMDTSLPFLSQKREGSRVESHVRLMVESRDQPSGTLGSNPAHCVNKVLGEHSHIHHLHIAYGCFSCYNSSIA